MQIDRLKKLYALAEHGEAGEKENARALLDSLIKKYNITEADLNDEATVSMHEFKYQNNFEHQLLVQLAWKIAPERHIFKYRQGKGSRSVVLLECTKAEAIQVQIEFEFYKALWEEEQDLFFKAFIHKHEIWNHDPKAAGNTTMSADELRRMASMMTGMQDKQIRRMLKEAD